MDNNKIVQVVVGLPLAGPFDYELPPEFIGKVCVGSRLVVPFRQKQLVGYVVALQAESAFAQVKTVLDLLDEETPALDDEMMALTRTFADYYACSWGEAVETSLPVALRKKKKTALTTAPPDVQASEILFAGVPGTPDKKEYREQESSPQVLCQDFLNPESLSFIVDEIKKVRRKGKGVIYLVPETAQIEKIRAALVQSCGEDVAILDRELTASKELAQWIKLRTAQNQLVVGTRSAVFAPVASLGLIIIQDEDNLSYKQEQSPFYHVRQVARMRAQRAKVALLFVTPTPSAELWQDGLDGKVAVRKFLTPPAADFQVVNVADFKMSSRMALSFPLQNAIRKTLENKGKIVLFLNKRGFSLGTRCHHCGYTVKCERCAVTMSYLYSKKKMVCHLCQYTTDLPKFCPHCQGEYMRSWGSGIEKIESDLHRLFPEARIAGFDRETKGFPVKADIVVATQAVVRVLEDFSLKVFAGEAAAGHVHPAGGGRYGTVDLIGVLEFDSELNRFDFRAGQRAFALLIRLRQLAREKVVVQTYQPYNYSLQTAAKMDFEKFYAEELNARREAGFPPFRHLAEIVLRSPAEMDAFEQAKFLTTALREAGLGEDVEVMEPQPAHQAKLRDQFRFVVMMKGRTIETLLPKILSIIRGLRKKKSVIITVNVDP